MDNGRDSVDRRQTPPTPLPINLEVNVKGVVIPTWVAVCLAVVTMAAAAVVLSAVLIFKTAADSLSNSQNNQTKEIRIIDVHIQDIENVLIRNGMAQRSDFAQRKGGDQ